MKCNNFLISRLSDIIYFYKEVVERHTHGQQFCLSCEWGMAEMGNRKVTAGMYTIKEIKKIIFPIAKKYGLRSVYLFGSYSRGTATEKSDLDFRIDKGNLKGKGLFGFAVFYNAVSEAFNVPVDMVTTNSLNQDFLNFIKDDEIIVFFNSDLSK